jgi:CRP-like cAMP-binding protein
MSTLTARRDDTVATTAKFAWANIPVNGQSILKLAAHENLFLEGDDADFIYEVTEGVIACHNYLPDGRRQVTSFYHPGDVIGLSHDGLHHSNCSATGFAQVRSIPRSMLMREIQNRPEMATKLLSVATNQLAMMESHFVLLGRKCAIEKVASFILALARRHAGKDALSTSFKLQMNRTDIADYLGLTIETVSRSLTKLRVAGVVEMPETSMMVIPDMFELEQSADRDTGKF